METVSQVDGTKWNMFYEKLSKIPEAMADLLEGYSGIPKGPAQIEHVLSVRNRAHQAYPYPCLGRFRFLELDLATHPLYKTVVLPKMKAISGRTEQQPVFLDIGTCLGQDVRKLVYDGAKPESVFGSDIVPAFIDAGYELFRDKDRLSRSQFLCPADVFDLSQDNPVSALTDKVDILHITAVFHLFSEEQQAPVAELCLRLLRKTPGTQSLILGKQVGNVTPQEASRISGRKAYRHNQQSWQSLWENVAGQHEFKHKVKKVETQAVLHSRHVGHNSPGQQQEFIGNPDEGFRWMVWSVVVSF